MSGPFGSSQWMYSSGGFYPTEIEQSLRFNDDDSAYLSWTPASAGNRKTWTWSGWVKRGNIGVRQAILATSNAAGNDYLGLEFQTGDTLVVSGNNGSASVQVSLTTNAVFRDTSAWYHIVLFFDTTQATSTDRVKLYVNGVLQTFSSATYPPLNYDGKINTTNSHNLGSYLPAAGLYLDGYLAEVNFIDGQALDPTDFGEFKSGVWVAKEYTGSYGTNGLYLPFKQTTVANGFNVVTYTGNGGTQSIEGVGFAPDLVWGKARNDSVSHNLFDSVRGGTQQLVSNTTAAEVTRAGNGVTFDPDGFTLDATYCNINNINTTTVAWCWDAGSGSPVSNTDGSITSTVKANPAYGFSVVSYTGNNTAGATVGHGLGVAPSLIIIKNRDVARNWLVFLPSILGVGNSDYLMLDQTGAEGFAGALNSLNSTSPSSSVITLGNSANVNESTKNFIAYCFAEISGYSSIGSYTGNGSTSGPTITTGFKPAFVMIKGSSVTSQWNILDNTRDTDGVADKRLFANLSNAEGTGINAFNFTSTGFEITTSDAGFNSSGDSYIYMAFADTRDAAFWRDLSGNDNTWQPNRLQNSDVMPDSPTNNFCTMNPTWKSSNTVLENGNLYLPSRSYYSNAVGTIGVSSGKWYFEARVGNNYGSYSEFGVIATDSNTFINKVSSNITGNVSWHQLKYIYNNGTLVTNPTSPNLYNTSTKIIGCALDLDNNKVYFHGNGTWEGSSDPDTDTGGTTIAAGIQGKTFVPLVGTNNVSASPNTWMNFGQDGSFAGTATPQGNTDENGYGDFYYAPPSGYLALCTANLPDPAIDPAKDDVPADYFNTVTWTGDATTKQIPLDFTADFVWAKRRNGADSHVLYDFIRGENVQLTSNSTAGDTTNDYGLDFLGHNYLEVDGTKYFGGGGGGSPTFVAWNWLAGNGTSSNTDGSITSTVSVNQKAGFSVVGYDSNPSGTVGHGLGQTPKLIIEKKRDAASDWLVGHTLVDGSYDYMRLNTTAANANAAVSAPTSTVFTPNATGNSMIAYCFAEVEGYSKFCSYTGNGSTDGPFVYTGFRPAWVLVKRTDVADSWVVHDGERDLENPVELMLFPNLSSAELGSGTASMDFLSNGFKLRVTSTARNASGGTYIFMAFAENPFKYSNAR